MHARFMPGAGHARLRAACTALLIELRFRRYLHAAARLDTILAARRFLDACERHARLYGKAGFDPDQPRVPAGNPDGGQWTSAGGAGGAEVDDADSVELSASRRRRPPNAVVRRFPGATPGQLTHYEIAAARAREAVARVHELDPHWRPTPSAYESIEGAIRAAEADAAEARARYSHLQDRGIGPGRFAGESISARGPERNFTPSERREGNRIGYATGCHTCGKLDPETLSGDFVLDHQPPTGWNPLARSQWLFPQCITCSLRQGGWIRGNRGRRP